VCSLSLSLSFSLSLSPLSSFFLLLLQIFIFLSLAISWIRPSSPRNTVRSSRDTSSLNYRTVFVAAVQEQSAQQRIVNISRFVVTVTSRAQKIPWVIGRRIELSARIVATWLHGGRFQNEYFLLRRQTTSHKSRDDSIASVSSSWIGPVRRLARKGDTQVRNPGGACTANAEIALSIKHERVPRGQTRLYLPSDLERSNRKRLTPIALAVRIYSHR